MRMLKLEELGVLIFAAEVWKLTSHLKPRKASIRDFLSLTLGLVAFNRATLSKNF